MGVSSDAILAFGFDFGEDNERFDKAIDTLYDRLPEKERSVDPMYSWEKQDIVCKKYGIQLVTYCSDSYAMHILAATEIRSYRGDANQIKPLDLLHVCTDQHLDSLMDIREILEIKETPMWFLVSWMG